MKIKESVILAVITLSAFFVSTQQAKASSYSDEFIKCINEKTSVSDRKNFGKWAFIAVAQNPEIQEIITIDREKAEEIGKNALGFIQQVYGVTCKNELALVKEKEGATAANNAMMYLGKISMQELDRHPAVLQFRVDTVKKYSKEQ